MSDTPPPDAPDDRPLPRWEDLEAFLVIASGVEAGKTIQQVGEAGGHGYGGPRLLYERLGRLEDILGSRLVERRKWSRNTHLTDAGQWLTSELRRSHQTRHQLQRHFLETAYPVLTLSVTGAVIGALLPPIMQEVRRSTTLRDLRISLKERVLAEDVIADVHENRAQFGLAFLRADPKLLHDVRLELLGKSRDVLLCPTNHPFAVRARHDPSRAAVQIAELAHEIVIVQPDDTLLVPPPSVLGERLDVPRLEQARSYVRACIGATLSLEAFEMLRGRDEHVVVLPIIPRSSMALALILPRKREGLLAGHTAEFLDTIRKVSQRSLHTTVPNLSTEGPPARAFRRSVQIPTTVTAAYGHGRRPPPTFIPDRDITATDRKSLRAALVFFQGKQFWEDYVSLSDYLIRLNGKHTHVLLTPTPEAWTGMEAILNHWRSRENWYEFTWYALALRTLTRFFGHPELPISPAEWEGMFRILEELRAQQEWYNFVRHASRLVRLNAPRPVKITTKEWEELVKKLDQFRAAEEWFDFAWLARSLMIVDGARSKTTLKIGATEWRGMLAGLTAIRTSANSARHWFTFAQHAYSLARMAGRSLDVPSPVLGRTKTDIRVKNAVPAPISR